MALELNPIENYGQLSFINNTIESQTANIDIEIGLVTSPANLILNRNTVTAAGKTFGLEDGTSGQVATLSSDNGKVIIAGAAAGLIVGNIDIFQNTIESTTGNIDLIIGNTSATANLILSRNTVTSAGKTFGLEDVSDNQVATLSAVNGKVVIAGAAAGLIVGQVEIFDNTVESTAGNVNLVIGNTVATANLVLSRNTVMSAGKTFTTTGNVSVGNLTVSGTTTLGGNTTVAAGKTLKVGGANVVTTSNHEFDPFFTDSSGTFAGATARGSYTLHGDLCYFRINIDFSTCTNFGTGQYQVTLPFKSITTMTQRSGTLHQTTGDVHYHIAGIVDLESHTANPGDTMFLYYSRGDTDLSWEVNRPTNATTVTSHFDIWGWYQVA